MTKIIDDRYVLTINCFFDISVKNNKKSKRIAVFIKF